MSVDLNKLKKSREKKSIRNNEINLKSLTGLLSYEIRFFKKLKDKNKERFFSEFGMLLDSGVDLQTILKLSLSTINTKNKLKPVYEQLSEQIENGLSLADSMENTHQFNNFDCYSIKIGESTGELALVFSKLADYYSKKIAQSRKLTSAMSYPLIVLITTVGAVFFMLKFVVPMFADTLTRFGGELPPITRLVIYLSEHITSYFIVLLLLTGTGILFYSRNKNNEKLQNIISKSILSIPLFGKLIYKSRLLQFSQAMELLLNAKVNIVDSTELAMKMIRFYPLNKALRNVKQDVLKGNFYYDSMLKQNFFDQSMIILIKIGEEVNQLDKVFTQLTKQYQQDLEYQSGVLISILEPILLLLLALIVGTILIAMYLPMFKIGSVIH